MASQQGRQASESLIAWEPLPHQVPPEGDWYLWLLMAGRFAGKTDACAAYVSKKARLSPIRIAVIAPTLGDARQSCVEGPSGLLAHDRSARFVRSPEYVVRWPNGSRADLFGAFTPEDVERLRAGGNRHLVWCEELAAWRQLEKAFEQMELGLRLGQRPHAVASTTPKPRPFLKRLIGRLDTITTRASSDQNPHIAGHVRARLFEKYEGTRLARQELYGELLEDVEGALWRREWFDREDFRIPTPDQSQIERTVVALDPASGDDEGDEQAITVACRLTNHHFAVLHSEGVRISPDLWLRRALTLAREFDADAIVYERNYGHAFLDAMVSKLMADEMPPIPYHGVDATRGKRTRAEPIAMLYEQGKVHHVGTPDVVEDQMATYSGLPGETSPDRLDATVWALTEVVGSTAIVTPAAALSTQRWD